MQSAREVSVLVSVSHSRMVISERDQFIEQIRDYKKHLREIEIYSHLENTLQDARYVIKSVICDPNFERLVLGCIEADFCK